MSASQPLDRKLVVGNWKMNGDLSALPVLGAINTAARGYPGVEVGLAVPATLLIPASETASTIRIGAQDIHSADQGAFTGRLSAPMVRDAGATFTLVGHSECRADHAESNAAIQAKASAALRHGLSVILCVGEAREDRDTGRAEVVVRDQLAACLPPRAEPNRLCVAYEPIWAIGSGRTPRLDDIASMHKALREGCLAAFGAAGAQVRLLYGGSVAAANAAAILATLDVDGVLVGGASLTAEAFVPILAAA